MDINDNILAYIETQRAQGMAKDRIQAELIRAGWSVDEIHKAFLTKTVPLDDKEKNFVTVMRERALQPVSTSLSLVIVVILATFLGGLILYEYWYAPKYVWAQQTTTQTEQPAVPVTPDFSE